MEKLVIPEGIKAYIIRLYKYNVGINTIQRKLREHFDFEVSRTTIYKRLNDWNVEKGKNLDQIEEVQNE